MTFTVRAAREGGWFVFANEDRLLVTAESGVDFIEAAWRAIRSPDGFRAALDVLTRNGLGSTPAFVLAEWGAQPRLIVRGGADVTVTDDTGTHALSASGVATWLEQSAPKATALTVTIPGAEGVGPELPLVTGAAWIASVSIGATVDRSQPASTVEQPKDAVVAPAQVTVAESREGAEPETDDHEGTPVESTLAALPDHEVAPEPPAAAQDEAGYDYLFGATMYRSVTDAAVHAPDAEESAEAAASDAEAPTGDHDGHTVLTSDIAKLRGKRRPKAKPSAERPGPAPELVVLVSTTGAREPLGQPLLVGRSPSVSQVPGGKLPRILAVDNADHDVSRNHAQVAVEGGTPVVTDLHSRNGTTIVLPGKKPQKLRAGEPTTVIVGTVIDFGGGLTLTIEES